MAPRKQRLPKRQATKETKVALGDTAAMKHALDAAVIECFVDSGYEEDHTYSNIRLTLSFLAIALALLAQFFPGKFAENWILIFCCVLGYAVLSAALTLFSHFVQSDVILVTKTGKKTAKPLRVSSLLPRFSATYSLTIDSTDPHKRRAEMQEEVGKYFYADGILADHVLSCDISKLLHSLEKTD